MRFYCLLSFYCLLFILGSCASSEQGSAETKPSPFEQTIEGTMITDYENIQCTCFLCCLVLGDSRKGSIEDFITVYGEHLHSAKSVVFNGTVIRVL